MSPYTMPQDTYNVLLYGTYQNNMTHRQALERDHSKQSIVIRKYDVKIAGTKLYAVGAYESLAILANFDINSYIKCEACIMTAKPFRDIRARMERLMRFPVPYIVDNEIYIMYLAKSVPDGYMEVPKGDWDAYYYQPYDDNRSY